MSLVPATQNAFDIADRIHRTDFVPDAYKGKPEAVAACLLYGQELGLGPMQALNSINVIHGKVSLSPEGMRALVLRAGHKIWPSKMTDTSVVMSGQRHGTEEVVTVEWTIERAKKANLVKSGTWTSYPQAMLSARATSELCRMLFPDVIAGLSYSPEEAESFAEDKPPADAQTEATSAPPYTIVQATNASLEPASHDEAEPEVAPAAPVDYEFDVKPLIAEIDRLDEDIRKNLGEQWKEAGLGSTKENAKNAITKEQIPIAEKIIRPLTEQQRKRYNARKIQVITALKEAGITSDGGRHEAIAEATADQYSSSAMLSQEAVDAILDWLKKFDDDVAEGEIVDDNGDAA